MRVLFLLTFVLLTRVLCGQTVSITPGAGVAPVLAPTIRLEFETSAGLRYQIESSEDLKSWKREGYAFLGNGMRMAAMVSNHGLPRLFYRVRDDASFADMAPVNPYGPIAIAASPGPSGAFNWDQIAGKPTTLSGFGITDAATAAQGRKIDNTLLDVLDFGAKADVRLADDSTMSEGSPVLTSPNIGRFSQADVGKFVRVSGAAIGGEDLLATITSCESPTSVTLSTAAARTVSGAHVVFGTDSSAAVQAAINLAASRNVPIVWLPKGIFMFNVELKNGVTIRGSGAKTSALKLFPHEIALINETLIYPADARRPVIHAQFAFNSQIEHLTVMGTPSRTTLGVRIGIPWSHQWLDGVTKPARMNGDWLKGSDLNGRPSYSTVDKGEATSVFWDGSNWVIRRDVAGIGPTTLFSSSQDVATPDLVTSWSSNSPSSSGSPVFRRGVGFVAQGFKISRCNLNAHNVAFQIMRSADTIAEFVTVGYSKVGFFCGDENGVGVADGALFIACTSNFVDNVFKFNLTKQAAVIGGNFNYSKTFAKIDEADVSFSNINIEDISDQVFEVGRNGALVVNTMTILRHPATGPTVAITDANTYVRVEGLTSVKYFVTPGTMNSVRSLPGASEVRVYSDTTWTTLLETREERRSSPQNHPIFGIREYFAERQTNSPLGNLGWTLTNISGSFIARPSENFKEFGRVQEIASATNSGNNLARLAQGDYLVWARNSFECGWTLTLGGGDLSKARFRCGLYSMDSIPTFTPAEGIGVRVDRTLPDSNIMFEVIKGGVITSVDTGLPISNLASASQLVISRSPSYLRLVIRSNGFPIGSPKAQVSHSTSPSSVMLAPMMLLGASSDSFQSAGLYSFYYTRHPD